MGTGYHEVISLFHPSLRARPRPRDPWTRCQTRCRRPLLWLQPQIDPFGVAGERHLSSRDARYQVQVSVEAGLAANRGIDKAGIVAFRRDGFGDPPAKLGYRLPDHTLLLDVEVVEGGDVTAGSDNQVAGA